MKDQTKLCANGPHWTVTTVWEHPDPDHADEIGTEESLTIGECWQLIKASVFDDRNCPDGFAVTGFAIRREVDE